MRSELSEFAIQILGEKVPCESRVVTATFSYIWREALNNKESRAKRERERENPGDHV